MWIGKLLKYLKHSASSSFKLMPRLELSWVGPLVSLLRMPLLNSCVCVCVYLSAQSDHGFSFLIINLKRVVNTLLFHAPFCIFCLINKWFESCFTMVYCCRQGNVAKAIKCMICKDPKACNMMRKDWEFSTRIDF